MSIDMFRHEDGCSPVHPCRACKATLWLRGRLTPREYQEFTAIVSTPSETKGLETPLTMLPFTHATREVLAHCLIYTVGDLVKLTKKELKKLYGVGPGRLVEIKAVLAQQGHSLL